MSQLERSPDDDDTALLQKEAKDHKDEVQQSEAGTEKARAAAGDVEEDVGDEDSEDDDDDDDDDDKQNELETEMDPSDRDLSAVDEEESRTSKSQTSVASISSDDQTNITDDGSATKSSKRTTSRVRRASRPTRTFDGNRSLGNLETASRRSAAVSRQRLRSGARTSRLRPRGDSEDDDTQSTRSSRSRASVRSYHSRSTVGGSSLRPTMQRLSLMSRRQRQPSSGDSSSDQGDNMLLLNLTKKVRQLETEKNHLQEDHEEEINALQEKLTRMQTARQVSESMANGSPKKSASPTAGGDNSLQKQLDAALATIAQLERSNNISPKKSEEPHLVSPPTNMSKLRGAFRLRFSGGGGETVDNESLADAPTSPSTLGSHPEDDSMNEELRNTKLEKLKAFRRSRETQLKAIVLDSQNSPTDVQMVISNLQDEVEAAKKVMYQQRVQLKALQTEKQEATKNTTTNEDEDDTTSDTDACGRVTLSLPNATTAVVDPESYKELYEALQSKYTGLELHRAWGEFQLRDRITGDALKYHRRLRHWKEQTQELKDQVESSMDQHAGEGKDLRSKLAEARLAAEGAIEDLKEYKSGTAKSLQELVQAQNRLELLERELVKYRPKAENDSAVIEQDKFLQRAIDRKGDSPVARIGSRLKGVVTRRQEGIDGLTDTLTSGDDSTA